MILCAIDDSDAAQGVLDTARTLAKNLRVPLVVIHVVGDGSDEADALVGRVRDRLGDEAADVRVAKGSPAEAIQAVADSEDAELLVVGSRGRGTCDRLSWAACRAIWPPTPGVPSSSSHPVGPGRPTAALRAPKLRAWCAVWMAQSRRWPGPCLRVGSPSVSTAGSSSSTRARTCERRCHTRERALTRRR